MRSFVPHFHLISYLVRPLHIMNGNRQAIHIYCFYNKLSCNFKLKDLLKYRPIGIEVYSIMM